MQNNLFVDTNSTYSTKSPLTRMCSKWEATNIESLFKKEKKKKYRKRKIKKKGKIAEKRVSR